MGPLCIADNEHSVVLQPSRPSSLLATLLIHSGTVVSVDYLLHTVWDTEPPTTARAALQSCVLRLRRLFAKYGIAYDTIESVPGGYRMRLEASTLDLIHFRELVALAGSAADAEAEARALRQALSLWQGPVLANVSSQVLHRDEVPRLTEERLRALERLCDIELAQGRCGQVLTEVWDAARRHPERERFSEQLMEALYRTGRQTEALLVFDTVMERLREDFGIDPGAPLQRLRLSILRGEDLGRAVGAARTTAALPTSPPGTPIPAALPPAPADTSAQAPAQALVAAPNPPQVQHPSSAVLFGSAYSSARSSEAAPVAEGPPPAESAAVPPVPCFAGRETQLDSLERTLTGTPHGSLIVVSGAPGIGKTALALQAAHRVHQTFPGGCSVVTMTDEDGSPRDSGELERELALGRTGDGRRLLILDDAVNAEQVRRLLLPPSQGATIVTSRRRLSGLAASHGSEVQRLDVLSEAEAEELLIKLLGPTRVTREPGAARSLARVCGYFPLSLRIAAARLTTRPRLMIGDCTKWLSADLVPRLHLTDEPHVSVLHVFRSALQRLDPELRNAFIDLAAAPRSTSAGSVLSAPEEVLDQLDEAGFIEEGPPEPYRIHSLFQVYARHSTSVPALPAMPPA
ncbi:BTAD domain-containing putative transcriptional regulator [Streptomyces fructofermentans]|uniref:BTAD domain-containing putative transcriptional regulator n=1 Tax=Streptomyces fructofermentans TaxID=152141 RepID=UPI0034094CE9